MTEQWKPIPGWGDLYEASSAGRVRSLDRQTVGPNGEARVSRGRVLAASPNLTTGRRYVGLYRNAKVSYRPVHQLILETFVGPRPDGMVACHNDGDHLNNDISNLRWDTPSSNMLDMVQHGTDPQASRTHCVNGHEFTPENTRVRQRAETGRSRRICRTCVHERARAHEAKVRELRRHVVRRPADQPQVNASKTHCRHGHEFTLENTRIRPSGARDCRMCDRLRRRVPQGAVEAA